MSISRRKTWRPRTWGRRRRFARGTAGAPRTHATARNARAMGSVPGVRQSCTPSRAMARAGKIRPRPRKGEGGNASAELACRSGAGTCLRLAAPRNVACSCATCSSCVHRPGIRRGEGALCRHATGRATRSPACTARSPGLPGMGIGGGRLLAVGQHPFGGALGDHQDRRVGVAPGDGRHHAGVGHAQAPHAAHPQARVDHRRVAGAPSWRCPPGGRWSCRCRPPAAPARRRSGTATPGSSRGGSAPAPAAPRCAASGAGCRRRPAVLVGAKVVGADRRRVLRPRARMRTCRGWSG